MGGRESRLRRCAWRWRRRRRSRGGIDKLVEDLAVFDHAHVVTRDFFDRLEALFEIDHFGREFAIARAQRIEFLFLAGDLRPRPCHIGRAAFAEPPGVLQCAEQYDQDAEQTMYFLKAQRATYPGAATFYNLRR